jgi:hypothetical protein
MDKQVVISDCAGSPDQQWTFTVGFAIKKLHYSDTSEHRNGLQNGQIQIYGSKCLDVTGNVNADGTMLQVWDCSATTSQQFVYTGFGDNQWVNLIISPE